MSEAVSMLLQDQAHVHRSAAPEAMAEEDVPEASSAEDNLPANTPLLLSRRQTSTG